MIQLYKNMIFPIIFHYHLLWSVDNSSLGYTVYLIDQTVTEPCRALLQPVYTHFLIFKELPASTISTITRLYYRQISLGFPGSTSGKEPTYQRRRLKRHRFDPWVGKIPWRRVWQPTPVLLPRECQGEKNLAGYSPWGHRVRHNWVGTLDNGIKCPPKNVFIHQTNLYRTRLHAMHSSGFWGLKSFQEEHPCPWGALIPVEGVTAEEQAKAGVM